MHGSARGTCRPPPTGCRCTAGSRSPRRRAIVPYLQRLGVTTCYTSPYFTAAPGSTHGYDVCNHNEISPEVGGAAAHREFTERRRAAGMGHIVDFVPNHMGIGAGGNAWWTDVLENGPSSPAANFFDIDWAPLKAELHAKLLLPILGDQYGQGARARRAAARVQRWRAACFATSSTSCRSIRGRPARLQARRRGAHRGARRRQPAAARVSEHPALAREPAAPTRSRMPRASPNVSARRRSRGRGWQRLVAASAPAVATHIGAPWRASTARPGQPASFDALHDLLEAQAYRLSYWRTASHEINYRRFFDINTLAGIRVERRRSSRRRIACSGS